ncbi:hypothetical protein CHH58_06630 [Terribacillus saccharophilus]|uniref:hypothetical protein n=1 Tax=Terribacillus saccharophilus TaxID=361277 RepID=UPI000BA6101E|nr:hypothetical protein [Terribacillus saccharophilus]PAF21730.1 hypothetical protein CHH49_09820 [Terribacillus saccharophilus]PAF37860.1 hypothetical protein CHH58_06630 [Terribacillus saccharophilus]
MLAVKEKQFEQVHATYHVSRDKRDWDRAKALWNKQPSQCLHGHAEIIVKYSELNCIMQLE